MPGGRRLCFALAAFGASVGLTGAASFTLDCGNDLRVHQVQMGSMKNFQYLIESAGLAMTVDAAWDIEGIKSYASERKLQLVGGLYTHGHFDHVGGRRGEQAIPGAADLVLDAKEPFPLFIGAGELQAALETAGGASAKSWQELRDGDFVDTLGNKVKIVAIDTPGHTAGGVSYLVSVSPSNQQGQPCTAGILLTGDTLFSGSAGRTDLPGGSQDTMLTSLARLAQLPADTVVLPGHDYGQVPRSTIGEESASNSWMQHARNAFASMPPPLPLGAVRPHEEL